MIYVTLYRSVSYRNLPYPDTGVRWIAGFMYMYLSSFDSLWHGSSGITIMSRVEVFIITAIIFASLPRKRNLLHGPLPITPVQLCNA